MNGLSNPDITQLLQKLRQGDKAVWDQLFPIVYTELHRIAQQQLFRSWGVETLNTTALVHETYLKLIKQKEMQLLDRAHFSAISAKAMRQILINYAEQKRAKKRGGDLQQVTLTDSLSHESFAENDILSVENALKLLAEYDNKLGQIVEMRFFGGMTEVEIAAFLGVTDRTVRRQWKKAKALLTQLLAEQRHD